VVKVKPLNHKVSQNTSQRKTEERKHRKITSSTLLGRSKLIEIMAEGNEQLINRSTSNKQQATSNRQQD
jgi:hypothetical protein